MPTYQLEAMFLRIGLALAAGVLIAIVPIALRKTRYEPRVGKRIFFYVLAFAALTGFGFFVVFLWNRYIPRTPEAPAPVEYPASPAAPVEPLPPTAP